MQPGELFTRIEAIASGTSDRALTDLVRSGQISRVARGVYRVGIALPDPEAIARGMKMALSHVTAAAWRGAALLDTPTSLHLMAPRDRGRHAHEVPGIQIHRADLGPHEVVLARRTLTTAGIRTGLDLSRSLPAEAAVATLDSLCRLGAFTQAELCAAAVGLPNAPGRRQAIAASELVDPRAESVFESISRVRIILAGLPAPVPQMNIYDRDGIWIARVDFCWPEQRIVLECDGFEYHGTREAFERDRRRWTALGRAGWRVVVVTWRDLMNDPAYLVDAMSDFLL